MQSFFIRTTKTLMRLHRCPSWFESSSGVHHNIGIEHGFTCINIRQVPWEVLKTEAEGCGFQHLPRNLENVNALKNHVRSLLLQKNWKHLLHFSLFLALFCFAFSPISRERNFHWLCSFYGREVHLVTAANMWLPYDHIERCVAVY